MPHGADRVQNNGKLTGLENFSRGLSSGDAKNTFREVYSRNDTTQLKLIKSDTDRRIRTAYLFAAKPFLLQYPSHTASARHTPVKHGITATKIICFSRLSNIIYR